jgi:exopolyphosphatase/guanosine-5'-triphosphate,3'-diphosphate pyrophosphatase
VRLAAIDVGSNSVHMVIADVAPDGRLEVVDRVKEMARLGRHAFLTGRLDPGAMDLAEQALKTFVRLARARRVEHVRAVATSAVREARNGAAFVRRLRRETGLAIRVISGPDEARLIFRAARHALGLAGGPHLLLDVGGGSVELALVQDGRPLWLRSLPLGVARISEQFLPADPPRPGQVRRLERHLMRTVGPLLDDARRAGAVDAVGTSGTVNTLVSMARAARGDELARLHGASATAAEIARIRRRVLGVGAGKRADLPGMDAKRVDLMPAAAVLIDLVVRESGARALVACGWALREGVLLDLAGVGRRSRPETDTARRRGVEALAARFGGTSNHGRQVARLSLVLFDEVGPALGLPAAARELLEYAALLHDIGHAIDHDRHHRHTYYLIRNADLVGFDALEVAVLAHVARAHRKQVPKLNDPNLQALPTRARRMVRALAALLRVADGLDRTHFGVVKRITARLSASRLVIRIDTGSENAELETWAVARRIDFLARLLDRPVVIREASAGRASAPARARAGGAG